MRSESIKLHTFIRATVSLLAGALLGACASSPPSVLVEARSAYADAAKGPAAQVAPVELKVAQEALVRAEGAYREDGADSRTKDLSYIALRRAEIAVANAELRLEEARKTELAKQRAAMSDRLREDTVVELKSAEKKLDEGQRRLQAERSARVDAEGEADTAKARAQTAEAEAALVKARMEEARKAMMRWAQLVENERGLVITLSSGIVFASGHSNILPGAHSKLDQVAALLVATPERNVMIEGHTDSVGDDAYNLRLSQDRADSVMTYLVSHGVPANRVRATGQGEQQPIATNATNEGRTLNRRVEIVLEKLPAPVP